MDDVSKARDLLTKQKYKEAGEVLDGLLAKEKKNDEAWYLRGVLSLKLKNYQKAQEHFDRAIAIKKKADYYKMKGMAYFEVYEIENAIKSFLAALKQNSSDSVSHFFLAVCYMLQDDGKATKYMKKAYELDAKKTKQLLSNFYTLFLEKDTYITEAQKKKILERIKSLK